MKGKYDDLTIIGMTHTKYGKRILVFVDSSFDNMKFARVVHYAPHTKIAYIMYKKSMYNVSMLKRVDKIEYAYPLKESKRYYTFKGVSVL